ncbi:MAG: cell division protein FtsQ [Acidobacteriota bacterium]|nr:cell division protein FtsQ [Acidobacteriota bacterium]
MLKEQVIATRGGRGTRGGDDRAVFVTTEGRAGKIMQRPSARRGAGKAQDKRAGQQRAKSKRGSWRALLAWAPLAAKTLIAVCAGLILFKGYRAAEASTFFGVRSVDVSGVSQASEEQIRQIVRHAATPTGVWKADLSEISAEIERQPWVRSAVVTRVLPSGLRVRITERVPRVVVRMNSGRFIWVDDDAVAVGNLTPAQAQPAFFMRGFDEAPTDAARLENRERVKTFMTLAQEWESAGLASRVSELNLDDLHDVRAQLAGDDSQIEVRLGGADWTTRLGGALKTLDTQRQTPRAAFVTYIDMTQGKRAVFGFNPHAQAASANAASLNEAGATNTETTSSKTANDGATKIDATNNDATTQSAKASAEQQHRASSEAKSVARAKTEAREAKSDAKNKNEKSSGGEHKGQQAVDQTRDGGRPRRVTKGQ